MANHKTPAEQVERDQHVDNALAYMQTVMADAELRGLSGADVATALAGIIAARNATLAGKCLVALRNAIVRNPVTQIVQASAKDRAELELLKQADGSYGPTH